MSELVKRQEWAADVGKPRQQIGLDGAEGSAWRGSEPGRLKGKTRRLVGQGVCRGMRRRCSSALHNHQWRMLMQRGRQLGEGMQCAMWNAGIVVVIGHGKFGGKLLTDVGLAIQPGSAVRVLQRVFHFMVEPCRRRSQGRAAIQNEQQRDQTDDEARDKALHEPASVLRGGRCTRNLSNRPVFPANARQYATIPPWHC
jgi:hypothetical protein